MKELVWKVWLPQALSIGVDYNVFWTLTPEKLEPFIKVFKEREEREAESFQIESNFQAWLQGVYITKAISACFGKNVKYPSEPIRLKDEEVKPIETVSKFEAWATAFNQQIDKKGGT